LQVSGSIPFQSMASAAVDAEDQTKLIVQIRELE
jgi:hypothetical protein